MNSLLLWGEAFQSSFKSIWLIFSSFVPTFVAALIIFIAGCILAYFLKIAITQLFVLVKIDKLFEKIGAGELAKKAGLKLNVSGFFGGIFKWFTLIVFTLASMDILGLKEVVTFIKQSIIYYLPSVIMAVIILAFGGVLAGVVRKYTKAGARALKLKSANLISSIVYYSIWLFMIFAALSKIGIDVEIGDILTALMLTAGLALGLSFGLGGKNLAEKTLSRTVDKFKKE